MAGTRATPAHMFDDRALAGDLGRRSARAGALTVVSRAVNSVVQLGSVLFLARLLTPEDYGVVAMVTALTAFGPVLVDLGTRDAVAQRTRVTERDVSGLFWVTFTIGCTFAVALALSGPLIAAFYGEPRLSAVVCVSGLTFVALGLSVQHEALLRRAVMFRELAIVDTVANVLSAATAIALAWAGVGYWALVVRPVAMSGLATAGVWWYCPWRPGRFAVTPAVRQMLKFGANLSGFTVTDAVARNADRVAVGRVLGARTLGYYQGCLLLYDNVLLVLVAPLHQVAVASLSKLQHDLPEFRRAWAKALSTMAFLAMPVFGVLAVVSSDLVVTLLGEKWLPAGALLGVLALRGIAHAPERTVGWLHVAAGRPDRWLRWGVVGSAIQLIAVFVGLAFGVSGLVWAQVACMYILVVPALAYAGRPVGIRARDVVAVVGPYMLGGLVAAGAGFAVRSLWLDGAPPLPRMAIVVPAYLAVYLVVVLGLFRVTAPLEVARSLVSPSWWSWSSVVVARVPWPALSRLALGFLVFPIAAWWLAVETPDWRVVPFFLLLLLALRVVPAVARRVLPTPTEVQARWAGRRELAKRFDSYQWRKLLWFGLGMALYLLVVRGAAGAEIGLALACVVAGALGETRWRRRRHARSPLQMSVPGAAWLSR